MSKIVVISIKPEFTDRIFDGTKKIELRKSLPDIAIDDIIIIYSTSPEKAVVGACKITEVIKTTPEKIWTEYSKDLGIDKKRFFEYYTGRGKAIGLKIGTVRKFRTKIPLNEVKRFIPKFSPPQTFKYYNRSNLMRAMSNEKFKDY